VAGNKAASSTVLEVRNLHLWRGDRPVLRALGLRVEAGQALQLTWPNGTGKTSLLRCLAGFLHPEEGSIRWCGTETRADFAAYCRDLAYLGHDLALKGDLTAAENLKFSLALRRRHTAAEIAAALAATGLPAGADDELVRRLSAGQQRRVALARLSLWGARLWLLDEPVANLDGAGQVQVVASLVAHLESGGSAILSTHQPLPLPDARCRIWSAPAAVPA
jgi:heme exporter protein A